jgi:sugar-specific transcriptional regulator TrmB
MQIDMLKAQNTKPPNTLDLNAEDLIIRAMDSEERTHKTLEAERAKFESNIRRLKDEIKALKADQVDAQERIDSLSNKLERAEKARVEALRCTHHRKEAASPRTAPPAKPPIPSRPAIDKEAFKKTLDERILAANEQNLKSELASIQAKRAQSVSPMKVQPIHT